jgi:two-component system response regulator YesN
MILADDEPVITKGIRKLVDFNALGIEIIGEYEDGKAALDGILMEQPDIALLDINMPKKTGIEILKEIKLLNIGTKVIFISGFQDFQYAKDALTYGAVDYLLKPILKEELVSTLEKCILTMKSIHSEETLQELQPYQQKTFASAPYEKLVEVEDCRYLPVIGEVLYGKPVTIQEQKLIRFSVISYMEEFLTGRDRGIVFVKEGRIVLVMKNPDEAAGELLYEISEKVRESMACQVAFVIGEPVDSMGEIPVGYEKCRSMEGYFYFADQFAIPIFRYGEAVYKKTVSLEEIRLGRKPLVDALLSQDDERFLEACARFKRLVCQAADGRKDDACFHYGSTIRILEERFEILEIKGSELEFKEIMEQSRRTKSYEELVNLYDRHFKKYKELISAAMSRSDKKYIFHAMEYIENHYMDNLTLEVLAGEVHMNPYYFSSYFKKNSGENFKDYLNQVRMKHGVSLLVSTDKKTADIAQEVGFRDNRSFSELFHRIYGENPSSYRKRLRGKG